MVRLAADRSRRWWSSGLLYGLLGVAGFSLTLPATRVAVASLDPTFVGLGRALVAAMLAAVLLVTTRQPRPTWSQLRSLVVIAGGVIFGFPLLSAWAMIRLPSAHGAIVLGVLPLATALVSVLRAGERPSPAFWLASCAGSTIVVGFSLLASGGRLETADLALLGAVAAAAVGYAEGGRLARELGGWQVISWALVAAAPVIAIPVALAAGRNAGVAPPEAWLAFAYVAVVSAFMAMFAWYHGMAIGGVARVSQLQLLQPFLTILASAWLLGEAITGLTVAAAVLVLLTVAIGRRTAIRRVDQRASLANEAAEPLLPG
ncbi:MAG TPA: DMT family transporter [Chloroflexia bacterium]|nr:DMT family transporter [Chloroflexia bacterium]